MKFSCTQENLKRGLLATGYVAGKNVNLPILNNVMIKIEGSSIQLISTNLEIAVRCIVRGKVDEAGEYTVPSKLFMEYVNLLPEDRVDMETTDAFLKIACRKNSTKIKGIPSSEFPLIPTVDRQKTLFISGSVLKRALGQVNFAISSIESRPELTGALFSVNPPFAQGSLVIAATDSYRLSEKTISLGSKAGSASSKETFSFIVPGKSLQEVVRILALFKENELEAEMVEVAFSEGQVAFSFGDVELISRLIDGRYPDYRPIIPEKHVSEAVFRRPDAVQAVKGASLFARAGLQDVHFKMDPTEGLVISSSEGQMGKNDSTIEAEISGPQNSIVLNYRYFLDGLAVLETPKARMRIIDAMNACILVADDENQKEKFLYIVMPIKQ
ncbi:MAG: DNA polymerase III subunit beta [Patescibacteria group bacterium]|nr:MAG: DNA polymerase III subunit beta [Patescibacteria group bacterium]